MGAWNPGDADPGHPLALPDCGLHAQSREPLPPTPASAGFQQKGRNPPTGPRPACRPGEAWARVPPSPPPKPQDTGTLPATPESPPQDGGAFPDLTSQKGTGGHLKHGRQRGKQKSLSTLEKMLSPAPPYVCLSGRLCVCVYTCMHACTHIHMWARTHVRVLICMCVDMHVCECTHTCVGACMCNVCTYVCIMHTHACTHVCVHIAHTGIAYVHTCTCVMRVRCVCTRLCACVCMCGVCARMHVRMCVHMYVYF